MTRPHADAGPQHSLRFVVPLESVRHDDVAGVGMKAAALGALCGAGFPIPAGLCLTTEAWVVALGAARLHQLDDLLGRSTIATMDDARETAAEVERLLADLAVPPGAADDLDAALAALDLPSATLAVRSSATAEDRPDASFAGQYATVLGVRGRDALHDAILTCWHSFFLAPALFARAASGAATIRDAMAVLIQPMVAAECAGVLFSVDPVQRRRDLVVIEAAWGLGAGVVDGTVATDTTWLSRDTLSTTDRRIAEKPSQVTLDEHGCPEMVAVAPERRRVACLPEPWARRIAEFGIALEALFDRPQDVEWAIADQQVWILQSRPLTTLPADMPATRPFPVTWPDERAARRQWRLAAYWLSSRERALRPLEQDYMAAFVGAGRDAAYALGEAQTSDWWVLNGRGYEALRPTGLRDGDRRARQQALDDHAARLRERGETAWDEMQPDIQAAYARLDYQGRTADTDAAVSAYVEDAFGVFRRHWQLHWLLFPALRAAASPFIDAFRRVSGLVARDVDRVAFPLLEGDETPFTRLIDGLYDLAQSARLHPPVAAMIAPDPARALERLAARPDAAPFLRALDDFLERFGHHVGAGQGSRAHLDTPTWRENPALVLQTLLPYLDPAREAPSVARARAAAERRDRFEAYCASCQDREAVAEARRWLPLARKATAARTGHNDEIDNRTVGYLREAVIAAARRLVARGILSDSDDIFYLYRDEIVRALQDAAQAPLTQTVRARREQHEAWARLEPPTVLGVPAARLGSRPSRDEAQPGDELADGLRGQGASPGRRRGRARIVGAIEAIPAIEPGDVLVAANASPMWLPIFPVLGALVLDHGAVFQHAATTAREYGVPAVVGTRHATRAIPQGAWVTVDGTAGTIEVEPLRLEPQAEPLL